MKKLFALLLAAMMLMGAAAFADGIEKGTIVYGANTELSGDFTPAAWWQNGGTDHMIRGLTDDCYVTTTNQGGEYIINPTVTESIESVMNNDGTKTFTVKINEGLVFNNGDPITAADFVWPIVMSCHPKLTEGTKLSGFLTYEGGADYHDGKSEVLSGVHLIDDYTYSVTIVADKIPYYYELAYLEDKALSMKYWLGETAELHDDGEGAYLTMDLDDALATREKARFYAGPDRVSAGPYNLVAFDKNALQATFTKNPNYAGNFEGQKPEIEKIVVVKAEQATWADQMKTGAFNFFDTITDGDMINTALDMIAEGGFNYSQFDRAGYGQIVFQCDFGPTQFKAVRHAVAKLIDRNEFANTFCKGWGGVVHGPYGTGLWQFAETEDWLDENLNTYDYDPAAAEQLLIEDGWVYNADGSDWTEGNIRHKKVTPEEAGSYAHNVTLADGTILMPLEIEWSASDGNPISELINVMLVQNEQTAKVGMKINQNVMTFTELLNYFYRDASQGDKYGVPTYGMFNLATGFNPAYDQSYQWTTDPELMAEGYNLDRLHDDVIDWLSMKMVYGVESDDTDTYLTFWKQFVARFNELLPELPLYSNVYVTMYPDWLEGYEQDSFWDFNQAILYATVAE